MANSSSLFQQPKKLILSQLNYSQREILNKFHLNCEDFVDRDWFNHSNHETAFEFLHNKKYSIQEIFAILDKLNKDQALGIVHGMSREEVMGLSCYQIDAFLKNGLSRDDIVGLGQYQILAFLALKNDGIKSDMLRMQPWLNSSHHLAALIYLFKIKKEPFTEICDFLSDLKADEANAISYGVEKNIKNYPKLIPILIASKEYDGLKTCEEVAALDEYQIAMVKRLYHWGLTSKIVKDHIKQTGNEFKNIFLSMVLEKGMSINDLLTMIDGLNVAEVRALSKGLNLDDIKDMNEYQIQALEEFRTIKNNLRAADLRDKKWFNSRPHLDALKYMAFRRFLNFSDAMQELDGLTRDEAKLMAQGNCRDDVVGLNKFHLNALEYKFYFDLRDTEVAKLTGSHLRGKDWFNSKAHVEVLYDLLVRQNMDVAEAITQLEGLNEKQLKLLSRGFSRDSILQLTPAQFDIMHDCYYYYIPSEMIAATWLQTKEQVQVFKTLTNVLDYSKALLVLKFLSDNNKVQEVLYKINQYDINHADIRELENQYDRYANPSNFTHEQDADRSRSCRMM